MTEPKRIDAQRLRLAALMREANNGVCDCGSEMSTTPHQPWCLLGLLQKARWRVALDDMGPGAEITDPNLDKCIDRAVELGERATDPPRVYSIDLSLDADSLIPEVQKVYAERLERAVRAAVDLRETARRESHAIKVDACRTAMGELFEKFRTGAMPLDEVMRLGGQQGMKYGAEVYDEALRSIPPWTPPPTLIGGP